MKKVQESIYLEAIFLKIKKEKLQNREAIIYKYTSSTCYVNPKN